MIVVDTHVLIWALQNDPRLGPEAARLVDAEAERDIVLVAAMSVWEIALLDSRDRIALSKPVRDWLDDVLALPGIALAPLEPAIALDAVLLPGSFHKDPADRMIVATARHHDVPLLTSDSEIIAYAAKGHLRVIDARY